MLMLTIRYCRSGLRTWYCHQATAPSQPRLSEAMFVVLGKRIAVP